MIYSFFLYYNYILCGSKTLARSMWQHLVSQLLVELLCYRLVESLVEIPRRDPHRVDHLHQHEHDDAKWASSQQEAAV